MCIPTRALKLAHLLIRSALTCKDTYEVRTQHFSPSLSDILVIHAETYTCTETPKSYTHSIIRPTRTHTQTNIRGRRLPNNWDAQEPAFAHSGHCAPLCRPGQMPYCFGHILTILVIPQHWRRLGLAALNALVTTVLVLGFVSSDTTTSRGHQLNCRIAETTLGYFVFDTIAIWIHSFDWGRWVASFIIESPHHTVVPPGQQRIVNNTSCELIVSLLQCALC